VTSSSAAGSASASSSAGAGPLHIVLAEFLPSGGLFQFTYNLGDVLAKAGHQVTLLTGPDPEFAANLPNYKIVSLFPTWHPNQDDTSSGPRRKLRRAGRAGLLAWSWVRLIRYTRRHQPDIVQVGELRFALDSVFAILLGKLKRGTAMVDVAHNPVPYDVHGSSDSVEKSDAVTTRALRAAYRSFDLVMTLGPGPRDQLLSVFPEVRRTAIIDHGSYSQYDKEAAAAPTPGAVPPRVLFFGSWTRYKNLPLLLEAFAKVRAQIPEAELIVAGPVMPDVDLAAIEALAASIPGVRLRPGYVATEDVPMLFGGARLVALPYEIINISGVVHLAYTFGRPVVATDVGSMRDVVTDGVTGLLAPPSVDEFAAALLTLLAAPAEADRMGRETQEYVARELSWEGSAARVVAGYRSALGQ
jgi:glycosyltransferase involved in cell wall biosynthesis